MTIIAAADGSALGNPGPAGWGWYVDDAHWAAGGWPHGTNNQGELTAVLDLLEQTAGADEDLVIHCDSTYVIKSVTQWMAGWKRKGWRKGDGKPVMNVEIMRAIDAAMTGRWDRVRFEWVKGHSGHALNEKADELANGAATAYQRGLVPDPGPGWPGGAGATPPRAASSTPPTGDVEPAPDLFSQLGDEPVVSDEEQVIALERSLLSDVVRSDPGAVAALLHPQWTEVGRSGRVWTRDEMLEEIGPLPSPASVDVLGCMPAGPDALLLRWRSVSGSDATLRASVWVRSNGAWQQLYHQGTPEA